MDLGHRVRDLRNAQHLSQVELAARASIARNTLNRIENGHLMPTAPVIEHLAEALDVTPGALFEEPAVPLDEVPKEAGRPGIAADRTLETEIADYDPYHWVQDKTTEELQQLALEEARFAKPQTVEELFEGHKTDKDAQLKEADQRVMATPLIRNIIGVLELRGASAAVKTIKLAIKQHDAVMDPPEETPQEAREAQGGKEAG